VCLLKKIYDVIKRDEGRIVFKRIHKLGYLDKDAIKKLYSIYESRFLQALKIITEDKVKKYIFVPSGLEIWIVVGKTRDYLILDNYYCSCVDYMMNVALRKNRSFCYHLLAKMLAESLNQYELFKLPDSYYKKFISEWRKFE